MKATQYLQNQAKIKHSQPHQIQKFLLPRLWRKCTPASGTLLFLAILMVINPAISFAQSISRDDSLALVSFYNRFNGDNWHDQTGWLQDSVSNWYGIEVEEIDQEWRVTGILLDNNMLYGDAVGIFFDEMFLLSSLKILDLSHNRIVSDPSFFDELFEGMNEMRHLEVLKLSGNRELYGNASDFRRLRNLHTCWFEDTHIFEPDFINYIEWAQNFENMRRSGLVQGSPPAPALTRPANHADNIPLSVTLRWDEITIHPHMYIMEPADSFRVQLAEDELFKQVLADTVVGNLFVTLSTPLEPESTYFWRVRSQNEAGPGIWPYAFQFTTMEEVEFTILDQILDGSSVPGFSMIGDDFLMLPVTGKGVYSLNAELEERFMLGVGGDLLAVGSIAHDSSFYIGSTDNWLYAFNKNGAPLWNAAAGGAISSTPVVDSISNLVVVGVENRNVLALDRLVGSSSWSFFADSPVRHSPVVSANRIMLVASADGTIYGLDLESSQNAPLLWDYSLGNAISSTLSLGLPDMAYATTDTRLIHLQFNRQGMEEVWSLEFDGGLSSSPVIDAYNHVFIADEDGVLYSIDGQTGEEHWQVSLQNPVVTTPALGNGRMYVVDKQGVVYAIDPESGAINWQFQFDENPSKSILYSNGAIYIGSEGGRVIKVHEPVTVEKNQTRIKTSAVAYAPLWATEMGNNRRTGVQSSDILFTSIDDPGRTAIPEEFELSQNYPNPFNPSTRIRYSLPEPVHVTIAVFDIAGRHVATLVDGLMPAGEHIADFDAAGLSSGIYVYRIQAGDFVKMRSMTLVK